MPKQAQKTRHFRITEELRRRLGNLKPGDMVPTVAQLTIDFDAASGTIERALRTLKREGIIERPPGKQRLIVRRSNANGKPHIALIRPDWVQGDYDVVLNRIQQVLLDRGWTYQLYPYHDFNDLNIEAALEGAAAGVLIPVHEVDASLSRWLEDASKPLVVLREPPQSTKLHWVAMDNFRVGYDATRYLLNLGHRHIACLISESQAQVQLADRVKGWRAALHEAGIDSNQLLYSSDTPLFQDPIVYTYNYLRQALPLDDGKPPWFTACFCPGWPNAWALHRHLLDHGMTVPDDMSIIAGAEKETYLSFAPVPLTGYQIDLDHLGQVFLKIIDHALAHDDSHAAACATVGALRVVRESCGPPRSTAERQTQPEPSGTVSVQPAAPSGLIGSRL